MVGIQKNFVIYYCSDGVFQVQAENSEEMGRKNLTLSNSLPPGLNAQNSPPKNLRFTENGIDGRNHQHNNGFQNQHQVKSIFTIKAIFLVSAIKQMCLKHFI